MKLEISSLVIGVFILSLAIFRFKELTKRLCFFWVAFALITQSFSKYIGNDLWLVLVAMATIIIGTIQGIKKKDKIYILLIGTILILVADLLYLISLRSKF